MDTKLFFKNSSSLLITLIERDGGKEKNKIMET